MVSRLLSESPIHVLDAITISVEHGNFSAEAALLMLDISIMVNKMESMSDISVSSISKSDAMATIIVCKSFQKQLQANRRTAFINDFTKENKQKILNDLELLNKRLLKIYQEVGIEIHNDQ